MRSKDEIQKAHDQLLPIVTGEVDFGYPPGVIDAARASLDVLCWVLEHDHNISFQDNLEKILKEAERRGYRLTSNPS